MYRPRNTRIPCISSDHERGYLASHGKLTQARRDRGRTATAGGENDGVVRPQGAQRKAAPSFLIDVMVGNDNK